MTCIAEGAEGDLSMDLIDRQAAIDIERNATVDTNPTHFEAHQKFIQFMDDAEISSFGRWQWSNGFNTALTAVGIDLKKLPSAQPEYKLNEWCYDCKEYDQEHHCCPRFNRVIRTALQDAQPAIVRCKDCKYFERDIQRSWGTYNGCGVWTDDGNEIEVNQNDFCSYAERREE